MVQLIIGSIMVVSQATIVYLEWLLAPSRKLEDTGGIVTAGVIQERGDFDLSFEDSRRPPGLVLEGATLLIKRTPNCS